MSAIQTTDKQAQSDISRCKHCNAPLPVYAAFCGKCGKPADKEAPAAQQTPAQRPLDITTRYRITSLIRRNPYIQLSRAFDTQEQRPVTLRDIDISPLNHTARAQALTAVQREYDLLRRERPPDVMPVAALISQEHHLYTIAARPETEDNKEPERKRRKQLSTLQDLLQSGIGLPGEQIALTWLQRLSQAVAHLHQHSIVIGDLDPTTVMVSEDNYSGHPFLTLSWLPAEIRGLLPQVSNQVNASSFTAPEAVLGQPEARSDVYSLAALLYLLLTGTAPEETTRHRQRSLRPPRELNSRINSTLNAIIMQALATDAHGRMQSAHELAEALLHAADARTNTGTHPAFVRHLLLPIRKGQSSKEGTFVSSSVDNNKTEESKEAAAIPTPDDVTQRVVPLQAQMARRYFSRIKTRKLSPQEVPDIAEVQTGKLVPQAAKTADISRVQTGKLVPQESSATAGTLEDENEQSGETAVEEEYEPEHVTGEAIVGEGYSKRRKKPVGEKPGAHRTGPEIIINAPARTGKTEPAQDSKIVLASPQELVQDDTVPVLTRGHIQDSAAPVYVEEPVHNSTIVAPPEGDTTHTDSKNLPEDLVQEANTQKESARALTSATGITREEDSHEVPVQEIPAAIDANQEAVVAQTGDQEETHEEGIARPTDRGEDEERQTIAEQPTVKDLPQLTTQDNEETEARPGENKDTAMTRLRDMFTGQLPALPRLVQPKGTDTAAEQSLDGKEASLLKRMQRFVLGEQRHATTAAALIETPLRIQPNQNYSIRINVMGRDEPGRDPQAGLSALGRDTTVHIEVRSALYQNFAYIVQQADVKIPASGYAAEVTIPMYPLSDGPSGRRERLHIHFMDEEGSPLYEKPFVIELFISRLVQSGREGHNVLAIPL